MVEQDAACDLGHFADLAVLADGAAFYGRTLADLGGGACGVDVGISFETVRRVKYE